MRLPSVYIYTHLERILAGMKMISCQKDGRWFNVQYIIVPAIFLPRDEIEQGPFNFFCLSRPQNVKTNYDQVNEFPASFTPFLFFSSPPNNNHSSNYKISRMIEKLPKILIFRV